MGAVPSIGFPFISTGWQVKVDDTNYHSDGEDIGAVINLHFSGILQADWDGAAYITNIDNVPHRITLTPEEEVETSFTPPEDQPTFIEHEDGRLTFCLAPSTGF